MNNFQIICNRIIKESVIHHNINRKTKLMFDLSNSDIDKSIVINDMSYMFFKKIPNVEILYELRSFGKKKINNIFLLYTAKYIISFLKENPIYEIYKNFEQNISKGNYLKEYFEYLFNHGYSPFTFFSGAFTWAQTKEGHKFWENIHELFITVLAEELTKKIERHE